MTNKATYTRSGSTVKVIFDSFGAKSLTGTIKIKGNRMDFVWANSDQKFVLEKQ